MATEIYDNLNLKKASHQDARLITVATYANLPNPNTSSNFIYEGAKIYVTDEATNYQAQIITGITLGWVNIGGITSTPLVQGTITLIPSTINLDLSLVSPAIALCDNVLIKIQGGTTVTLNSITNWPTVTPGIFKAITFYSDSGKEVTYTHKDYDIASAGNIILEDGFDMTIAGRTIANESLTLVKQDVVFCQWSATQFLKNGDLLTNLLSALIIDNTLTSTSTTKALSAFQGKILKDLVDSKQPTLGAGDFIDITSNVIKTLPRDWEDWTPVVGTSVNPSVTIPTVFSSWRVNKSYYYIDWRSIGNSLWLLPPGRTPGDFTHWIEIDKPQSATQKIRYRLAQNASPTLVGTSHQVKFLINDSVGTMTGINFNSDGSSTEKVAFTLPVGRYEIKARVTFTATLPQNYVLYLMNTNGLGSFVTGLPAGSVGLELSQGFTNPSATVGIHEVCGFVDIVTANSFDGFMLALSCGAIGDLSLTYQYPYNGYIDITKIL